MDCPKLKVFSISCSELMPAIMTLILTDFFQLDEIDKFVASCRQQVCCNKPVVKLPTPNNSAAFFAVWVTLFVLKNASILTICM